MHFSSLPVSITKTKTKVNLFIVGRTGLNHLLIFLCMQIKVVFFGSCIFFSLDFIPVNFILCLRSKFRKTITFRKASCRFTKETIEKTPQKITIQFTHKYSMSLLGRIFQCVIHAAVGVPTPLLHEY